MNNQFTNEFENGNGFENENENELEMKIGNEHEFNCGNELEMNSEELNMVFNLIDERITVYEKHLEEQEGIILGNVIVERLSTLKELKEALEVQIGIKHYCTDCNFVQYEGDFENMDCGNVYALPEHGAPEIISSEPNTCPFYETGG